MEQLAKLYASSDLVEQWKQRRQLLDQWTTDSLKNEKFQMACRGYFPHLWSAGCWTLPFMLDLIKNGHACQTLELLECRNKWYALQRLPQIRQVLTILTTLPRSIQDIISLYDRDVEDTQIDELVVIADFLEEKRRERVGPATMKLFGV